jgi:hypothetical protein
MPITRRHRAVVGVLARGGVGLWRRAAAVAQAVEALRQAIVGQEKTSLEVLCAEQLRDGHSEGRVENTAQCLNGVMTRKALITSLTLSGHTIAGVGTAAVARHTWASESATQRQDHQHHDRGPAGLTAARRHLAMAGPSACQAAASAVTALSGIGDAAPREGEGCLESHKNPSCHSATAPAPSGCGEASMGY